MQLCVQAGSGEPVLPHTHCIPTTMGAFPDRLTLLIEQMKASDERLEAITSDYINKTTRQLKEMEEALKEE